MANFCVQPLKGCLISVSLWRRYSDALIQSLLKCPFLAQLPKTFILPIQFQSKLELARVIGCGSLTGVSE